MNKKDLVIETARSLFSQYGYKKVSMDEIAKVSGVTKKTIYTYFEDKESLFQYFVFEELENMKSQIEKLRKKEKDFLKFISKSIYLALKFKNESKLIANIKLGNSVDDANRILKIYDDEIIYYIELTIKREIDNKNIKECDAHLMAFIIYKIYISVLFDYDKEIDEKIVTEHITTILKDGLLV